MCLLCAKLQVGFLCVFLLQNSKHIHLGLRQIDKKFAFVCLRALAPRGLIYSWRAQTTLLDCLFHTRILLSSWISNVLNTVWQYSFISN